MVWTDVRLLCVVYVSSFCISFLPAGDAVLVPGAEPDTVWPVFLRSAAYRAGFRRQIFQSMALGEDAAFGASDGIIVVLRAHSDTALGGLGSWQGDRSLLCFHLLLRSLFYCVRDHGEKVGKPVYHDGLYHIWSGAVGESSFFQPL